MAKAKEASLRIARILESGSATTRVGRGALGLAAALCMTCCGVLEIAPQFVAFMPDTDVPIAQSQMPRTADFPAAAKAAVVPATFHPAEAQRKPLAIQHKPARPRKSLDAGTEPIIAVAPAHPKTPSVIMAKLDNPAPKPRANASAGPRVQMPMVLETSVADIPPAGGERGVSPAAVNAMRTVQVQTIQVLEEDETGWHVRTYRTVTVLPVAEGESMHSSI